MESYDYLIVAAASAVAGYFLFRIILAYLPTKLRQNHANQKRDVVEEAKRQAERLKMTAREQFKAHLMMMEEDFATELEDRKEDMKVMEEELTQREEFINNEDERLQKYEKEVEHYMLKMDAARIGHEQKTLTLKEQQVELIKTLETRGQAEAPVVRETLKVNMIENKRLEAQKIIKNLNEELNTASKRLALRSMSRVLNRYAPEFPWPKAINQVDIPTPEVYAALGIETERILLDMKELGGIEIEILPPHNENPPVVKLAGGMGVDREAVRLALTEMLSKPMSSWAKTKEHYQKHRALLEQQSAVLGKQAVQKLRLHNLHPEIQKMVGYLNWRTSYRQNQYLHTVEVAVLAGIVAAELGVDPDHAKRVGLLHDIGKAIDYRIEGSHAVISGDYADRFGESRLICDTVMSHHNDLVIETPLAFVLKSADTLSGARPGARVNLEEGYQIRLSAIDEAVRSFNGVMKLIIMNGGREVHVEVNNKRVREEELQELTGAIARKIEETVQFPGQIKVMITRRFEATAVA